jgi:hypothetical protein
VYELIRNDIFTIDSTERFDFLISLLDYNNQSLKHAITSLVSVISSTLRGVEYLTHNGKNNIVIEKIIRVLKIFKKIICFFNKKNFFISRTLFNDCRYSRNKKMEA